MVEVLNDATHAAIRQIFETSQLDVARLLRSRVLDLSITNFELPSPALRHLMQANVATFFESAVIGATMPRLDAAKTLEGLAKLHALAIDFAPDFIYVPDTGSQIVGQYLVAELKSRTRSVASLWRKGQPAPTITSKRPPRFLLVADVAMSGKSFDTFFKRVHREYGSKTDMRFGALVGSTTVQEELNMTGATFVSYLSADGGTEPPWERTGYYSREGDNHVFGAGSRKPWVVPSGLLDPQQYHYELSGFRTVS
jgi:hypothetical protein